MDADDGRVIPESTTALDCTGQLKTASVQGQVAPRYDPVFDPQSSAATSQINPPI